MRERINTEFNSLAEKLKHKLKEKSLNTHTFQEKVEGCNDISHKGIFSNQLFKIIEEVINDLGSKTFYNPNQLKTILFARVFGIDVNDIKIFKHEGRDYMCCKTEFWTKIGM